MTKFTLDTAHIDAAIQAEGQVLANCAEQVQVSRNLTNMEFVRLVDVMFFECGLTKLTKAAFWGKPSGEVRTAIKAIVAKGEASGAWQSDMSETLVHCVGVAFQGGVPFTRDLKKTHKADGTPRTEAREAADGASTSTSGAVTSTSIEALEKTLAKALSQARLLSNDAIAAGIIDLLVEINPAFVEATPKA